MKDQVDSLTSKGIPAAFINSTLTPEEIGRVQSEAYNGQLKILYVAPERLATHRFRDFMKTLKLSLIAIDEAHCISEWGHDFRPDYRNLRLLRDDFPDIPIVALTATATQRVRQDIVDQLRMPEARRFAASFNRPNLSYYVKPKRRSFAVLLDLLREHSEGSAIIYRFSRRETETLAARLVGNGIEALPYHAGLEDEQRRETQERFIRDEVRVVVATIAFGMGIDKSNIRLVVHYDLPRSIEGYYQETGRAGRDGGPSDCVLFFSYADKMKQEFFINQISDESERRNAAEKLRKMVEYGSRRACRRASLLAYFGEVWEADNCGACDVCMVADTKCVTCQNRYDGTVIAQKVLSAVIRTGERSGTNHVVEVLRGSRSRRVLRFRHDQLSVHGIARNISADELKDVVDQLVDEGLLERAIGPFPTISVSQSGRTFLKNRETLTLTRNAPRRPVTEATNAKSADTYDAVLFDDLRSLRHRLAVAGGVPAFVVFGDRTLRDMVSRQPTTREEFLRVHGVGPAKLERYGDDFMSAIAAHVSGSKNERRRSDTGLQSVSEQSARRGQLISAVLGHDVTVNRKDEESVGRYLDQVLRTLNDRESFILIGRYGLLDGQKKTLQALADRLSISRERVRQIEARALRKLRRPNTITLLESLVGRTSVGAQAEDAIEPTASASRRASYIDEVRRAYPRAYEKWTRADDERLAELTELGRPIDDIAAELGRQPSAIRSRLSRQMGFDESVPSHVVSGELIAQGIGLTEVASHRGLSEATVLQHLERLAEEGSCPDISHLLPSAERYRTIRDAFISVESAYLSPVRELLGENYSYEELRLVRLHMQI